MSQATKDEKPYKIYERHLTPTGDKEAAFALWTIADSCNFPISQLMKAIGAFQWHRRISAA